MKGIITLYSDITGIGQVRAENNKSYTFEVANWIFSENFPEKGMEVEFELEDNKIVRIAQKTELTLLEKLKKEEQEKKRESEINLNKQESIEQKIANELGFSSISVSLSYQRCLELYFDEYLKKIEKNLALLSQNRIANYFLMKRFLITAYNTLMSIDKRVSHHMRLKEIKDEFEEIQTMYTKLVKFSKLPKNEIFERAFLEYQSDFLKVKAKKEELSARLNELLKEEVELAIKIKRLEENILKLSGDEKLDEIEKLKIVKSTYADVVQEISDSRNKIDYLNKMITDFMQQHISEFLKPGKAHIHDLEKKLLKILDAMTFEFDYILWNLAKNSRMIRNKFEEAGIEGSFCTKTFIKYYLLRLDPSKLTDFNQKLTELLEKIEKEYKKLIFLYLNDVHKMSQIKHILEFYNKDYQVHEIKSIKELIYLAQKKSPDVLILSFKINDIDALQIGRLYFSKIKRAFTDIYVFYKSGENPSRDELRRNGIRHIIKEPQDKHQFETLIEKLAKLL